MRHGDCHWCVLRMSMWLCDASSEEVYSRYIKFRRARTKLSHQLNCAACLSRDEVFMQVCSLLHAIFGMKCSSQTACVYRVSVCWFVRHVLFPFSIRVNFPLWLVSMRHICDCLRWLAIYVLLLYLPPSVILYAHFICFGTRNFPTAYGYRIRTHWRGGDWKSCHSIDDNLDCGTIFLPHL